MFTADSTGTHLAEESVEVTNWQRQTADNLRMCRIEFFENVVVVARRYAVLRTIKGVHQRQDVAVEGKNTPTDETWCVEFSGSAELL